MPGLFDPLELRSVTLRNRVVMSPMCQYSASADGTAADWHMLHYPTRAVGGAGLILIEATAVEPDGRISEADLGLWSDRQASVLADLVDRCHRHGAAVGVQLAHAGRKAWSETRGRGPAQPVAPSAAPFDEGWVTPRALDDAGITSIVDAFRAAAARALAAGCDVLEIHAAHGYLLHEFLTPLVNRRDDRWGGDAAGRRRLSIEVIRAVRAVWPADRPLLLRASCTDWVEGGLTPDDLADHAGAWAEAGVDLIDCSSGGALPVVPPASPGYQVPFAERIRRAGLPTCAVGLITEPRQADAIVREGRADLVALGRALLRDPYWPLAAARALGVDIPRPRQYLRARA